ncbi:MAG: hypothetical protein ABI810_13195 [Sphingomonas bacterium]
MTTRIFVTTDQAAADRTVLRWQGTGGHTVSGIGPSDLVQLADVDGNELWSNDGEQATYVVIVTDDSTHP